MHRPAVALCGLLLLCGSALAQQRSADSSTIKGKATPVEKVVNANPESDGKAYRIDLQLRNGQRVSYEIPPTEALKIADGLSKPATPEGQKDKVAQLVYGMTIQADPQGRAVILTPRDSSGNLQSLAVPLTGADQLLETLTAKIAEAKAFAAKQPKPDAPKQ